MEFKIDSHLLSQLGLQRTDAVGLVKKWGLDRHYNPYAPARSLTFMDADETVFFARELEYVKKRAYNKLYPSFLNTFFVPVDSEADTGADSITFESYDSRGEAAIIDDEARDYQRAEILKEQTTTKVKTIGQYVQWNLQELRRSAMAIRSGLSSGGKSISQRKIDAALRGIAQKQERIVAVGDSDAGLNGFFNNSVINAVTFGNAAGTSNSQWSAKSNDEIHKDIIDLFNKVRGDSQGVHVPNTIIVDIRNHTILSTKRIDNTNVTLLSFIKKSFSEAGLKLDIYGYPRVSEGLSVAQTRAIAYERNADNLQQEIPQPTEVFPPQQVGTAFRSFVRKRHGGVQIRYEGAFSKAEWAASA